MEQLKPCPFCGGKAKLIYNEDACWWYVKCTRCNVTNFCEILDSHTTNTAEEAIGVWNQRYSQDDPCATCGATELADPTYYCAECTVKTVR